MKSITGTNFITSLQGIKLSDHDKKLLNMIKPLGLIFFAHNFADHKAEPGWEQIFKDLIHDAIEASEGSIKITSIDFEGGRVNRFPSEVRTIPYANEWEGNVKEFASEMASILKSFNLNMNYAPVLDIHLEPTNPVIGPRAFSDDPLKVIDASTEFFDILSQEGILTCGKHFPGHGRSTEDSHLSLPLISNNKEELEIDLAPFKALIEKEIPFILTAHAMYPVYDDQYPASLSEKITTDLLRKKLGYKGIIITDDLEMKALNKFNKENKAVLALEAGCDIILVGNEVKGNGLDTTYNLMESINKENLSTDFILKLEESRERIMKIVSQYPTLKA